MNREPRRPTEIREGIPEEVEGVILACLSKNPDDRPTAAEVQKRLYRAGLSAASESPSRTGDAGYAAAGGGLLGGAATQNAPEDGIRRIDGYPGGRPSETVSLPTRTFQGRRDRGPLIVGVVALVFLLAAIIGAFALLGGGAGNDAASNSNTPNGDGSGGSEGGDSGVVDSGAAVTEETTAAEETVAEETSVQEDTGPLPPTEEAGQVVFDYYVALTESRFDDAWANLSSGYQEEVGGTVGDLEDQETSLDGVFFDQGVPTATLDGREARVDFTVSETRSGSTEDVSGTWVAVSEDGEWKLDRLE